MYNRIFLFVATLVLLANTSAKSQLAINTNLTPVQLIQQKLIGTGVSVTNITYTGSPMAIAAFNNGGTTNIGLASGVLITSGDATIAPGPNSSSGAGVNNNMPGDPQLQALIPGYTVYDAAVIEFDFVPLSDTVKFRYVFASEEYDEYANSSFNDVFGFFISGTNPNGGTYNSHNIAIIPGTTNTPVSINNVNNGTTNSGPCINCQYYVNNNPTGLTIEYDAFTTVLTAWAVVVPCQPYHFKIAIGDAGDGILDSGVFLEENSFSTDAIDISTNYSIPGAGKYMIEGCNSAVLKASINKWAVDTVWIYIDTIYGTATNGVDFPLIPDSFPILPGSKTGTLTISPVVDYITEGIEYVTLVIPTSVCTIDTVTIPIIDYNPITLTMMNDTLVCGDPANLWVQPSDGAPPYHYDWTPPIGLSNPNTRTPTVTPPTTTTYSVYVSDSTGCPGASDSVVVEVAPKPNVSFMADVYDGCEPLTVNFTDASNPSITAWNWSFGDGNNSTQQNPSHTYAAGVYDITLEVTTNKGCKASFTIPQLINVYLSPTAYFEPIPPIVPINNASIFFQDMSTNPNVWQWNFGDYGSPNNTSTQQNPTHIYSDEGTYTVWLVVTSIQGCKDSISKEVSVVIDSITVPNIITPNGDGFNDYLFIENIEKVKSSTLLIYNRWGKKIYERNNYDNSWNGEGHSDGTYFWVLKYKTFFRDDEMSGTVTILRDR